MKLIYSFFFFIIIISKTKLFWSILKKKKKKKKIFIKKKPCLKFSFLVTRQFLTKIFNSTLLNKNTLVIISI